MILSSCSINNQNEQNNNSLDNYSILTNYSILYAGEPVSSVNTEEDTLELTLQIVFQSDVPFTLTFGLIDNFTQRKIKVKEDCEFKEDTIFTVNLPKTEEEFQTSNITIIIDGFQNDFHDLIFFLKNNTKIQSDSIRGYDFLRVNINGEKIRSNKNNLKTKVPFTASKEEEVFLEISPNIQKKGKQINCELQFNIDKIYEGEQFIEEYKNHLNEKIDFTVMVFENNKLLNINDINQYVWSESTIGENGKIKFSVKSETTNKEDIVLVLVPYPFINYTKADRYQLIAYNDICYYHYKFDESVELIS